MFIAVEGGTSNADCDCIGAPTCASGRSGSFERLGNSIGAVS